MTYPVKKCFELRGKTYQPAGDTPVIDGALNTFSGSHMDVTTLLAAKYICEPDANNLPAIESKQIKTACPDSVDSDTFVTFVESGTPGTDDHIFTATNADGSLGPVICGSPLKPGSITGNIVDNTDPQNPVVTERLTSFAQDGATGVITHTNEEGTQSTANITRAQVSPDGQTVVITDGVTGQACTVPKLEQDQVLAGFEAVPDSDPNDGVTTWHWQWIIHDIDGNEVSRIAGPTIEMPEFVSKAGTPLTGPITPLLADDFVDGALAVGDKVLVLAQDGSCKLTDPLQYAAYNSSTHAAGQTVSNTVPLPCPSVGISKKFASANPDPVFTGSVITWNVKVWNSGCVPIASLTLTDDIGELAQDTFGPLNPGQSATTTSTYTIVAEDEGTIVCNTVSATATDAAGQTAYWEASSEIDVLSCEPICYTNFIEGLATDEPAIAGQSTEQHLSFVDSQGDVFAQVSWANQTSPVDPVRLTLSSPAGVPPELDGWNSMTINAGIPKEQVVIDFSNPTCGPFSIILVDLDYTTVGGLRHTIVDNFSVEPSLIEVFPVSAGLNVDAGTGTVVSSIDTSSPDQGPALAPGTVVQDGLTYRLDFNVNCVSQITFDVDVTNWSTADSELFTFAFMNRTEVLAGCRQPTGVFLDGNDVSMPEPDSWEYLQEGKDCSLCNCD